MRYSILLVDDEEEIVDFLEALLKENDYCELDFYRAYNGREALEQLRRRRIDVLLSDIRMPGMDGLRLLDVVKDEWPLCKVIFLTGFREFDDIYYAISQKQVRYLLKTEPDEVIRDAVVRSIQEIEAFVSVTGANGRDAVISQGMAEERVEPDAPRDAKAPGNRAVTLLRDYICADLTRELSLSALAEKVYFTPEYLSRVFRQETGQKLSDYITQQRIAAAKRELTKPGRKIQDIAAGCGYDSAHSFARAFKKETGISPKEYREKTIYGE